MDVELFLVFNLLDSVNYIRKYTNGMEKKRWLELFAGNDHCYSCRHNQLIPDLYINKVDVLMFNIRYCFMQAGKCVWWDLPLAIILTAIGIYLIRKYDF